MRISGKTPLASLFRLLLVGIILGLAFSGLAIAPSAAAPVPAEDPFYVPPAGYESTSPGTVLRTRAMPVEMFQTFPLKVQSWQLLYRTTDFNGHPYASVTTLMVPDGPTKPRPLLSYQTAYDSTNRQCAPSYTLHEGAAIDLSNPNAPWAQTGIPGLELALAAAGLEQGWAVAMPDPGGIDNHFFTRDMGYAVLDGVRAAEHFGSGGLAGTSTPVGFMGYSGGGIGTSWTAEMQPSYAPELNVAGMAYGAPVPDGAAATRAVGGHFAGGLLPISIAAGGHIYPGFAARADRYLTPQGRTMVAEAAAQCPMQPILGHPWLDASTVLNVPVEQFLADPVIAQSVAGAKRGVATPTAPIYLFNGINDEASTIASTDALVAGYCASGARVTYRRVEFPDLISAHGAVASNIPAAFAWLKERLEGGPAVAAGCDTRTVLPALLTPESLSVLGPSYIGNIVLAVLGQAIGSGR